ncbi:scramblase Any1p [Diutina catenulata]
MISTWVPETLLPYLDMLPDVQKTVNFFMAFTPLFSYGTTCYGIWKKKTSLGFSIDICATMMMASLLRILYYLVQPYEKTLLRQSVWQLLIQCLLLHIALRYRSPQYDPELLTPMPGFDHELNAELPRRLSVGASHTDPVYWSDYVTELAIYCRVGLMQALRFFDVYYQRPFFFWQWKEPVKYWRFIGTFAISFAVLTFLLVSSPTYGTFLGTLGLFIESLLPLPQILMLKRLQSVDNFKLVLLFSWYGGDLTKLGYLWYGTNDVSLIFFMAAFFQMSLDVYIGYQYVYFKYIHPKKLRNSILDYEDTPSPSVRFDQSQAKLDQLQSYEMDNLA